MSNTTILPFEINALAPALFAEKALLCNISIQHKSPSLVECILDVTGCDKDDIKIDFSNDNLAIHGNQVVEISTGDDQPLTLSRPFSHSIPLPSGVSKHDIQSQLTDNKLSIYISV